MEYPITFEYEWYETQDEIKEYIDECEGKHKQQVVYSAYHSVLTQICFNCRKIRTNMIIEL